MKSEKNDISLASGLDESAEELYEMAPCGYLSTTPDGKIIKANRTLAEWIGCTPEELVSGMRISDLLSVGSRIFYETHLIVLLRLHGFVDEIALDMTCRNGRVIPTLVNARQKRNAGGEPVLNRFTLFNTTERRAYERELLAERKKAEASAMELLRLNDELGKSNSELLKANAELAQFAYAASHDLQEPLRTVTAYTQLLVRRLQGQLDADTDAFVRYIIEGSARMRDLIEDLLAFSRAQSSDLVRRPTGMKMALDIALANLHSSIADSNTKLTYGELPTLNVDAPRIVQVLQNLIGNAIKYRKPDEPPRVNLSAERMKTGEWLFTVEDNGLGFETQYSEQIFGMFKRLHGRDIPGTGIGLAICRKIIESHGGRIWATSNLGFGSKFCFTLPDKS